MTNPIQSAGRRFIQKFGVAFLWATLIGLGLGAAAYYRVDRRDADGDPVWHVIPRLWLESLELRTVDWRARSLGGESVRPDEVVLVNIDEETLNNARESEHPDWAMRPWPRELLGQVVEQLLREGAARVYVDGSFVDVSPRQAAACKGEAPKSDDAYFGELLAKHVDSVVVPFEWNRDARRPPDRPLTPFMLKLADVPSRRDAWPLLRRVLMQRTSASLNCRSDTGPLVCCSPLWARAPGAWPERSATQTGSHCYALTRGASCVVASTFTSRRLQVTWSMSSVAISTIWL